MKVVAQSILSLALGFCGGVAALAVGPRLRIPALRPDLTVRTLRAERFELVSPGNERLAYWGRDWPEDRTLLVFLDEKGRPRAEIGVESRGKSNTNLTPFVTLLGSDGKPRMQQRLDPSESAVFEMGDTLTENRVAIGHWIYRDMNGEQTDPWEKWSMVFSDSSNGQREYLDLGVTSPLGSGRRTGYLLLRDSLGHVNRKFAE